MHTAQEQLNTAMGEFLVGIADFGQGGAPEPAARPAGPNRDTTAARRARTRAKHDRWAEELRAAGWHVLTPEELAGVIADD